MSEIHLNLLTKRSYVHINVRNCAFTQLGKIILKKGKDKDYLCQGEQTNNTFALKQCLPVISLNIFNTFTLANIF